MILLIHSRQLITLSQLLKMMYTFIMICHVISRRQGQVLSFTIDIIILLSQLMIIIN